MRSNSNETQIEVDEPVIDRSFIGEDLGVGSRTVWNYQDKGILPLPDANFLGRDVWRQSTYRKFKADLLAGKFAMNKIDNLPHMRIKASRRA